MSELEIHQPESLAEVFVRLKACAPDARPMGGGTALMLMMKAQLYKPSALVSLAKADQRFRGIEWSPATKSFSIGAMATFDELDHDANVRRGRQEDALSATSVIKTSKNAQERISAAPDHIVGQTCEIIRIQQRSRINQVASKFR